MSHTHLTLNPTAVQDDYAQYLAQVNDVARYSQQKGNHPFGAIFVLDGKVLLEAHNTVNTEKNHTRHAEMNLVDKLYASALTADQLRQGIVFASTEPCTMCATALVNSGVKHMVYGCSAAELAKIAPWDGYIDISLQEVVARCVSGNTIQVQGPLCEAEALAVHHDFWPKLRA